MSPQASSVTRYPTQVKLAGSHHVLADLWPPSNLPTSSLSQHEAGLSSQPLSANPQRLLPAGPHALHKDLWPDCRSAGMELLVLSERWRR